MSSALALASLFWTRNRRGLTLVCGYWMAVIIVCRAVPAGAFTIPPDESIPPAVMVFVFLCSGWLAALGYLLLLFSFSREVRLEARESGFPARLWTLPLPTRALVGWPMLCGSAAMILGWVPLAWAARRPCSCDDIPLLWPSLCLATVQACLQAIVWIPFPLPWVRAFLFIPLSIIPVCTPILALHVPSVAVCGLLVVLLPSAYLAAIRGVARARRGDNVPWNCPAWLRWRRAATRTRQSFASAARAQLWFEWRLHGLVFPMSAAILAIIFVPTLSFYAETFDNWDRPEQPFVPTWLYIFSNPWISVGLLFFWFSQLAAEFDKFGWRTCRMSSFLVTRPVSEAMLVRAKLEAAAWSTLAGWGVLAVGSLLWLALGGLSAEGMRHFEAIRQRYAPGLFWGWLTLLVGGAVVLTWLRMVQGMWLGLTGSTRLRERSVLFSFATFVGLIVSGYWLAFHPEYWPVLGRLLPWLAGAAVVLKCLAAVWSLRALRRRDLVPSGVVCGMLVIWLAIAAGLFAALYALLPEDWFSVSGVVLGIVLLLPLTRLALAPLALAWNRHR